MGKGWKNASKVAMAAKKGAMFTKFAREIAVSAKLGGPDPASNSRLALAIAQAKAASCPKDTIERAIKKGAGIGDDGVTYEETAYEGFGPHQVGVIVECQTDNKNRTVTEIRNIFKKHGGQMGDSGSVAWMFDRVSLVEGKKEAVGDPEEEAIEAGANEVEGPSEEGTYSFYGVPEDLDNIRSTLSERGWEVTVAELSYKAKNITELNEEQTQEVLTFLEALDDNDDSHRVHATLP
ncbi:MAG: YebC/PmpR family DNA-binding transcriptional regulator [Bdellovibrionaceae bacterium]|nr:YebC/PmpR family DNA-binding transcriptional regulator [Bdellovibrionales bacterium]MCB9083511.1 YebC/PmpR family DNA-binding transcriptional regulator [Pseudobdellovibrionaceae bacterium]